MRPAPSHRIHPKDIQDPVFLSRLLEFFLYEVQERLGPTLFSKYIFPWETTVPWVVWQRLMAYYRTPADWPEITVQDLQTGLFLALRHYPTAKFWRAPNGEVWLEF